LAANDLQVESFKQETDEITRKYESLQQEFTKSSVYVQSADSAIEEMRQQLEQLLNGDVSTSNLLVEAATQRSVDQQRIANLEHENDTLMEQYVEESKKRKHLHNMIEDLKGNIRVVIRMRPLLKNERPSQVSNGKVEIKDDTTVGVTSSATGLKLFDFYRAFSDVSSQVEIFDEIKPLMQSAIDGFNICFMAYGQTGTGKTYTIYGEESEKNKGILPRACEDLFYHLKRMGVQDEDPQKYATSDTCTFTVKCSMVELYVDTLYDLLDTKNKDKKIEIRQNPSGGTFLQGVQETSVSSAEELLNVLNQGNKLRQVHKTDMNDRSSRSHTIFTVSIYISMSSQTKSYATKSKILFVDLAGSERVSKSNSVGERFKEAQHINKSLSCLGDVIAALSTKSQHVPYRNSKLTLLLQDCLGGNSKTVMFANISPCADSISETMSTLQFASRVKKVHNPLVRNLVDKKQ